MEYKGKIIGREKKVAIIASRFNSKVTDRLKDGAIDCLLRHEMKEKNIDIFWVPGSFEVPMVLRRVMEKEKYDGYIAIAALIRGDTPHFDYIASETTKGIAKISLESDKPVAFGVVTADTEEQALSRAGLKRGNRGREAAVSVLEMIDLYSMVKSER